MPFTNLINGEMDNINTLWQSTPDTWQGAQAGQESYADLAARFLYLMGNQNDFRLVLSIIGPEANERKNGGVFSTDNEKLTDLLAELEKVGIHPKLVYHPGVQKETGDWSGDELTATVNDMAAFNNYITTYNNTNKSNLPVFTEYLLEGSDFGKNYDTMNDLRNMVNSNSALGIDTELWFTGDWAQGVTLAPSYSKGESVPDNGVYMQLYDMYKFPDLANKQTNPANAEALGKDFVDSLTGQGGGWNSAVFSYPNRAFQAFTFYDDTQITHAPGFYGSMATEPWDVDDFNTFTEAFQDEFELYSKAIHASSGIPPLLSIWYAENALSSLSPDPSTELQNMFGNQTDSVRAALGL